VTTPPIIVCTLNRFADHVRMFEHSCDYYANDSHVEIFKTRPSTFGADYNAAVGVTFAEFPHHDRFIIANDDVVLHPETMRLLIEDADMLDQAAIRWSHIAARTDRVMQNLQNIYRNPLGHAAQIQYEQAIAPIFSMIHRDRWVNFPPINWGSDIIQCYDMIATGHRICVSRAYVHHIGGITSGKHASADREASRKWCAENRPEFANLI